MKIQENIETISLALIGLICIVIPILDFTGILDAIPFVSSRIPEMTLGAIGIIALFLVVERYGRFKKIIESIEELRQSSFNSIFWESDSKPENVYDIKAHLFSSESLYLLGYSLPNILDSLRVDLPKAVNNGLKVRVLMYLDDNTAFGLLRAAQENPEPFTQATNRGRRYIQEIRESIAKNYKNPKGSFEAKALSLIPACSMVVFTKRNKAGTAKIVFYRPSLHVPKEKEVYRDQLCMVIQENNSGKMFDYYKEHFELLWDPGFHRNSSVDDSGEILQPRAG
jgi:hypothetical protein